MLQRLLFGLITVTSLSLVGCAHSPQQLSPEPKLTAQLAPVGHGQPVVVKVVDGRPSPTLGTRGGLYPETSAITVQSAQILPKLQAQAEAAVRLLGFTPTAGGANAPQLTVTLAELKYQSPKEGLYVTEATTVPPSARMCRTPTVVTAAVTVLPWTSVSAWRRTRTPIPSWWVMCSAMP